MTINRVLQDLLDKSVSDDPAIRDGVLTVANPVVIGHLTDLLSSPDYLG